MQRLFFLGVFFVVGSVSTATPLLMSRASRPVSRHGAQMRAARPGDLVIPLPSGDSPMKLADVLKLYHASLTAMSTRTMEAEPIGFCGPKDNDYDVLLTYAGQWKGAPYTLKVWLQVETADKMADLYMAINQNFDSRGLPPCALNDSLYATGWSDDDSFINIQPIEQPSSFPCGPYKPTAPLTTCNVADPIYP